jgi:endonuclease III
MALITCCECDRQLSDKAQACPHCGCPISYILENMRAVERIEVKKTHSTNSRDPIEVNDVNQINELLKKRSLEIYKETENNQVFSKDKNKNDFVKNNPLAFVIGCLMDRQIKAERAWEAPYKIKEILGDFEFSTLEKISLEKWREIYSTNRIHGRFDNDMAEVLYKGLKLISKKYNANPEKIWNDYQSADVVVKRFREFHGVGPKISTMAVNILARDFKVKFKDFKGIDVSVDVHVARVMQRLGLVRSNNAKDIIEKARELNPEYPGIIDLSLWEIGRTYCSSDDPKCNLCLMHNLCPKHYN